jgi:hypothetical protein
VNLQSSWLLQGYFDFSSSHSHQSPSQEIRDALAQGLGLSSAALKIASYPVGPAWRYSFWWREGDSDYAEAQFFAQIGHFPILSLGVSVEKGLEGSRVPTAQQMNRRTWDWRGLIDRGELILSEDAPEASERLQQPINLRIRVSHSGDSDFYQFRTFSFVSGQWYERRVGSATVADIMRYLRDVDQRVDCWADVHFSIDLTPAEVEGMDATSVARLLLQFDRIRQRVHGRAANSAGGR